MSYLDDLIYDRTSADITNDTDKAYISYTDLNRVEGACRELASLLGVTITTKTWVIGDYRTVSDMQRLADNLRTLRNAYYLRSGTPVPPSVVTYSNITEANNVEKILADIYYMYRSVEAGKRTLSFRLGTSPIGNREV